MESLVKHQKVYKYYAIDCSLLGNILAGKGIVRAGSGNKKEIVRTGYGNKKEWDF